MSDPSTRNWRALVLPVSLTAAIVVLLVLIANAVGIIEIQVPWASDSPGTITASPSDITLVAEPEAPAEPVEPETTGPETESAGTWTVVYEEELVYLDTFLAGSDTCVGVQIDLDTVDPDTGIYTEAFEDEASSDAFDLIWDPCSRYSESLAYLSAGAASPGELWIEGTGFDAAGCFAETESLQFYMLKEIDPEKPSDTWFNAGDELCMVTDQQQVALGTVATVTPSTPDGTGFEATLEVSLWARE
jgi:hypothetical protein